jgi:AmmeMemoRadiSam system protein A
MSTENNSKDKARILLQIAHAAIAESLGLSVAEKQLEDEDWLQQKGACFITLTQQDQLRGCIGTLEASRTLLDDVKANAKAAAFKDTRFSPLTSDEFNTTQIELSLLSPMQALSFTSEQDALSQLQPEIDGVVFEYGFQRSTFLPQVWEQLPDAVNFMAHLKQKAGLPADFWADDIKLSRYTVRKWKESDFDMLSDVKAKAVSEA